MRRAREGGKSWSLTLGEAVAERMATNSFQPNEPEWRFGRKRLQNGQLGCTNKQVISSN